MPRLLPLSRIPASIMGAYGEGDLEGRQGKHGGGLPPADDHEQCQPHAEHQVVPTGSRLADVLVETFQP
jgi:hypothetical protein